jgi:hypothetical protein
LLKDGDDVHSRWEQGPDVVGDGPACIQILADGPCRFLLTQINRYLHHRCLQLEAVHLWKWHATWPRGL